ncbi:MAG: DEAD/DEAH box helicase family protein [Alloprevotella sp.]|nr:DEAD/DEAH box helicase family protein [Alloprevotella sp.]MBR1653257.1 DEAD/DEAH box helicase family protein [Alloprevotella sp.]
MVSTRIRKPGHLTVTTYQALLAAFCGQADEEETLANEIIEYEETDRNSISSSARFKKEKADEVINILKNAGVSLLCFDEAHHLRKEWWKALTYLNEHLKPEQTLALTATPPYDADYGEWQRYQELCGEIDEVISIPELVKNGDLCPHQDFIYFSSLKQNERELLNRHNQNVRTFIEMILRDSELLDGLSKMKFFEAKDADVEMIFESPEFYVSIASLLNVKGYHIPEQFLSLFDAKQDDLPPFDLQRASAFVKGFIEDESDCFKPLDSKKHEYLEAARRLGLIANKKVTFEDSAKSRRLIAGSLGKLDSIVQIVKLESEQLQERLRMVILADYIKMDDVDCQSIGVVPIWRTLKENVSSKVSIGVLCGTLILLPASKADSLHQLLAANDVAEDAVIVRRFEDDSRYIRVTPRESVKNIIVRLITEMFCTGDITVLIGTQALLGEGWDAPAINSLILSSTVSSYMLSNQMRGRAIRIDKNVPDKVSNIWHLATIDFPGEKDFPMPGTTSDNDMDAIRMYTYDLEQLTTRFKGFEAPSYYGKHEIVSGIERVLGAPSSVPMQTEVMLKERVAHVGDVTKSLATDREQTRRWWTDALYLGYGNDRPMSLTTGVEAPKMSTKSLLFTGYKYMIVCFLSTILFAYVILLRKAPVLPLTLVALALTVAFLGFMAFKYLRTGTVEGVMKQLAITVLETMSCQGLIKSSIKNVGLRITDEDGMFFVSCSNLPTEENNIFIQSLQELLDPVENPRYILIRHSSFFANVRQTDYFSLPALLSTNRQSVEIFKRLWEKYIGECETIYTRSLEGRKVLLKARKEAFSALKRTKSRRLSKWQ